jgi:putative acetyltransferase
MHTLAKARGKGIAKALVIHIENFARSQGIKQISLETGATEPFKPARTLYKTLGYQKCGAFGEYILTDDNTCMTKII